MLDLWTTARSTHASGTFSLGFLQGEKIQDLHPSLAHSLQRWTRDKVLSFVPPDGKFKLMEYRYSPTTASAIAQSAVPIVLRPAVTLDARGGGLELTLFSRLTTRTMENVSVELYLGEGATGASCILSHSAAWTFNPRTKVSSSPIPAVLWCILLTALYRHWCGS